jgi:hypothetical protein
VLYLGETNQIKSERLKNQAKKRWRYKKASKLYLLFVFIKNKTHKMFSFLLSLTGLNDLFYDQV